MKIPVSKLWIFVYPSRWLHTIIIINTVTFLLFNFTRVYLRNFPKRILHILIVSINFDSEKLNTFFCECFPTLRGCIFGPRAGFWLKFLFLVLWEFNFRDQKTVFAKSENPKLQKVIYKRRPKSFPRINYRSTKETTDNPHSYR